MNHRLGLVFDAKVPKNRRLDIGHGVFTVTLAMLMLNACSVALLDLTARRVTNIHFFETPDFRTGAKKVPEMCSS